jgi:hypothetical protein
MSEDMSDRMPEDVPVRTCINVMVGITRSKVIFLYVYQKVPTGFMKRGVDCPAKEKAWRPKRRNDQRYGSAIPRSVFLRELVGRMKNTCLTCLRTS